MKRQTILFGNGINRVVNNNFEWGHVLDRIRHGSFPPGNIPNTMQYEELLLNRTAYRSLSNSEEQLKTEVIRYLNSIQSIGSTELYEQLFSVPADYFLTTNYDNAYEPSLQNLGFSRNEVKNSELSYNMRRNTVWENNAQHRTLSVWPIHGNIHSKYSLMLGFDHYSGSIARLYDYLNNGVYGKPKADLVNSDLNYYRKERERKGRDTPPYIIYRLQHLKDVPRVIYWADLFFLSDVHIVGNALSFDEIDLWWVLNKRIRLIKSYGNKIITNTIYFYGYVSEEIKYMLSTYGVDVSSCITEKPNDDAWKNLYLSNISDINGRVSNNYKPYKTYKR